MKTIAFLTAVLFFWSVATAEAQTTPEPADGLWEGLITYKVNNLSLNQKWSFTSKTKATYHTGNFQGGALVSSPPVFFQVRSWISLRETGGSPVGDLFPSDGYGARDLFDFYYNVQDPNQVSFEVKSFKFTQNSDGRMTSFSNAVVAQVNWSFGVKGEVIDEVSVTWKWKSPLRWTPPTPE